MFNGGMSEMPSEDFEARSIEREQREALVAELGPQGVSEGYLNAAGDWVDTPTATLRKVAETFIGGRPHGMGDPIVCTPGRWHPKLFGTLIMEGGHNFHAEGVVDEAGYHILYTDDGTRHFVIAAPEQLPVPPYSWGWQIQLYAARSRDSWGIGDFRDLALICRLAARQGARCVQCSPVHAIAPALRPQDSPYSPASRNFLNLLHVAPGLAPGAERVDLSDLAARGRELNQHRLIDRAAVWALKRAALERIWEVVKDQPPMEFLQYRREQGRRLQRFSTWSALVEELDSPDWRTWPVEYRRPGSRQVEAFAEEHFERVAFHAWCQWVADVQYAEACTSGVDVLADLAVGFDSNSEDAWALQDLLSFGFEIGAPPDTHNTEGQRWGLPPFNPAALTRVDLAPFRSMVHGALTHAGALRIDHIMQLWRLYWVPVDGSAADGVYVYYPVDALLALLRLEASRHKAWIVGEDMGTVAAGVRETMAAIGMLGNRSAMRTNVNEFPVLGVGTSSTHDQVSVAGLLTCSDEADLRRIGKDADFAQIAHTRRALCELAHIDPDKSPSQITQRDVHDAVVARYRLLTQAPSLVVVVSLDDAAMVAERPNMPGTVDVYPNWRLALPRPIEEIMDSSLARDLVSMMRLSRGSGGVQAPQV